MSLEFDAPPLTRRERREREALLIANGATPAQAAELAGHTGVIDLGPRAKTAPAQDVAAGVVEPAEQSIGIPAAVPQSDVVTQSMPEPEPESAATGRTSAALTDDGAESPNSATAAADALASAAEPIASTTAHPAAPTSAVGVPKPAEAEEPVRVVDVEVVEVVEQIFSNDSSALQDPTNIPVEPGTETGPIHWTDALSLPANLDPTDPASMPDLPSLASDTNTIVLEEFPDVTTISTATGEIDLMVTGSILLPTSLTETGALPDLLDSEHVELNEDIADELPLSSLSPKSAAAAVNANAEPPLMVTEPPAAKLSTGSVIALTAGGAAAVVLIALGVGALFHLF